MLCPPTRTLQSCTCADRHYMSERSSTSLACLPDFESKIINIICRRWETRAGLNSPKHATRSNGTGSHAIRVISLDDYSLGAGFGVPIVIPSRIKQWHVGFRRAANDLSRPDRACARGVHQTRDSSLLTRGNNDPGTVNIDAVKQLLRAVVNR